MGIIQEMLTQDHEKKQTIDRKVSEQHILPTQVEQQKANDVIRIISEKYADKLKDHSIQEIENGNRAVEKTSKTIIELVQGINEVAEKSKELEELSETQTEQMKQAEAGVNQISEVVQSNAAIAEESSATSEELSAESISLNELVQQFKLKK